MGRKSHARSLSVWANGQRVGTWTIPTRGDTEFRYDPAWMSSPAGRPLSLSLPYTAGQPLKGERVRHFFDNLLPDSDAIRHRLATRFQTASTDAFDLLRSKPKSKPPMPANNEPNVIITSTNTCMTLPEPRPTHSPARGSAWHQQSLHERNQTA